MKEKEIKNPLNPIYNSDSKILILGTMPSPKSREVNFYYSHPNNRFWKVISDVLNENIPKTNEQKLEFLLKTHIALWDVIDVCTIKNAEDVSIKNVVPNDLGVIFRATELNAIFTTGKKASSLFEKYQKSAFPDILHFNLPSTSPANCSLKYEDLKEKYALIVKYL